MKALLWLILLLPLFSCQTEHPKTIFTILDAGSAIRLESAENSVASVLVQAGVSLNPVDKILVNGTEQPPAAQLPKGTNYTLQIRRAHRLTLLTPQGQTSLQTTAASLGQALAQAGLQVDVADFLWPRPETPLNADLTATYRPATTLNVSVDGKALTLKSSAKTVGQALAAAGVALLGMDECQPAETEPIPQDGQIRVIRMRESVLLQEETIPFAQRTEYSTSLQAGEQVVLQAGIPGLAVSRVRIRYADGVEVARVTEAKSVLRQPQDSLVSLGSQAQIQSLDIPGGQIQYWRAVQMFATAYSPCRTGTSKCSYGTASGLPVQQGVVAMVRALYNPLAGTQVYVPGYGLATIGDVGGGFPDGRLWIDLAYSDETYQSWSGMVTVYFLAPAPVNIPALLE